MDIRDFIAASIRSDRTRLKLLQKDAARYPDKSLRCRIRDGKTTEYYEISRTGKERYLSIRRDYKLIAGLQKKVIAEILIKIIKRNLEIKEQAYSQLRDDNLQNIMPELPRACHPNSVIEQKVKGEDSEVKQSENPYHIESLSLKTSFGLFVRSKGELLIAEILHSLGLEFYYEKKLVLQVVRYDESGQKHYYQKTYYPDFTIIAADGTVIYWEHKGLKTKWDYAERDVQKEIDYNYNGIYQSHNYIVTEEGPDNDIDMEGIMDIVNGWLIPRVR